MENLLILAAILLAVLALYGFRRPILRGLRQFNERNTRHAEAERMEKYDAMAHFRRAIALIDEQFEQVAEVVVADERTGEKIKRYRFLGTLYASREDADEERAALILAKTRDFYVELENTLLRGSRSRTTSPSTKIASKPPHP